MNAVDKKFIYFYVEMLYNGKLTNVI